MGAERVMGSSSEFQERIFCDGAELLTDGSLDVRTHAKRVFGELVSIFYKTLPIKQSSEKIFSYVSMFWAIILKGNHNKTLFQIWFLFTGFGIFIHRFYLKKGLFFTQMSHAKFETTLKDYVKDSQLKQIQKSLDTIQGSRKWSGNGGTQLKANMW